MVVCPDVLANTLPLFCKNNPLEMGEYPAVPKEGVARRYYAEYGQRLLDLIAAEAPLRKPTAPEELKLFNALEQAGIFSPIILKGEEHYALASAWRNLKAYLIALQKFHTVTVILSDTLTAKLAVGYNFHPLPLSTLELVKQICPCLEQRSTQSIVYGSSLVSPGDTEVIPRPYGIFPDTLADDLASCSTLPTPEVVERVSELLRHPYIDEFLILLTIKEVRWIVRILNTVSSSEGARVTTVTYLAYKVSDWFKTI